MTNETTKPIVTQAALKHIIDADPGPTSDQTLAHDMARVAAQALAHSPSEPSVVTQDLVPVAYLYERPKEGAPTGMERRLTSFTWPDWARETWTETPLYPSSAIEAAQIAARNEALDEAAKAFEAEAETWVQIPQRGAMKRQGAKAIRALRTPSQHQEEQ